MAVGIGGFIGSVIRYLIAMFFNSRFTPNHESHNFSNLIFTLPLHTLLVNIIGSLLIGIFISYFKFAEIESQSLKLFMTTGLMGGLTTFSTFSFEVFELLKVGHVSIALIYIALSLGLGILFCYLGYSITSYFFKLI
jgi:CrcB protein